MSSDLWNVQPSSTIFNTTTSISPASWLELPRFISCTSRSQTTLAKKVEYVPLYCLGAESFETKGFWGIWKAPPDMEVSQYGNHPAMGSWSSIWWNYFQHTLQKCSAVGHMITETPLQIFSFWQTIPSNCVSDRIFLPQMIVFEGAGSTLWWRGGFWLPAMYRGSVGEVTVSIDRHHVAPSEMNFSPTRTYDIDIYFDKGRVLLNCSVRIWLVKLKHSLPSYPRREQHYALIMRGFL